MSCGNSRRTLNLYIADGFSEDCHILLQRFVTGGNYSYQVFCNIWKDMEFSLIFLNRSSGAELGELSEEVLIVAKEYMTRSTNTFEESIGGLFLLYGLVHLQPYRNFAPVRFVPEDVSVILKMRDVARDRQRYDVLYILGSLLIEGPREFCIAQRIYGMERQLTKYYEEEADIGRLDYRRGVLYSSNEESDILRQLTTISQRYKEAKSVIPSTNSDRDLNYFDDSITNNLLSSLKRMIGTEDKEKEPPPLKDHLSVVRAIKERALKDAVVHLKHRQSVNNKQNIDEVASTENKVKKKNLKSSTGIKSGSPKKSIPTSISKKTLGRKMRKKRPVSSSPSSEGIEENYPYEIILNDPGKEEKTTKGQPKCPISTLNKDLAELDIEKVTPGLLEGDNEGKQIEIEILDLFKPDLKNLDQPSCSKDAISETVEGKELIGAEKKRGKRKDGRCKLNIVNNTEESSVNSRSVRMKRKCGKKTKSEITALYDLT